MVRLHVVAVYLPLLSICSARYVARQDSSDSLEDDDTHAHTVNRTVTLSMSGTPTIATEISRNLTWTGRISTPSKAETDPITVTLFGASNNNISALVFTPGPVDVDATDTAQSDDPPFTSTKTNEEPTSRPSLKKAESTTVISSKTEVESTKSVDRWPQGTPTVVCSNEEDYPDRVFKTKLDNFDWDRPRWKELKPIDELIKDVASAACYKLDHVEGVPEDSFIITDSGKFNYRAITLESNLVASVHVPNDTFKFSPQECDNLTQRAIEQCSGEGKHKFVAKISTLKDEFSVKIGPPGDDENNSAANPLPYTTIIAKRDGRKVNVVIINPGIGQDYEAFVLKMKECRYTFGTGTTHYTFLNPPFDLAKTEKVGLGPVYSVFHFYTRIQKGHVDDYLKCVADIEQMASPGFEKVPDDKDFDQFFCDLDNGLGDAFNKVFFKKLNCQ